ncbi:MAG: hypothetical protein COA58_15470 [Bacteroidetes bacterium]|nr:MAG: hypothetical protein COA58_15470 [Bacteroidota bacterium]
MTAFLCLEIARDIFREGDFGGYIEAGKLAWTHSHIYDAHRNTWPPFMSITAIPLHGLNSISFIGLRLVWLLGICITYWYIFKWVLRHFFQKKLVLKLKSKILREVALTNPLFLVPFLLNFRIFIEEVSNLQVNMSIMAICIVSLILTLKKQHLWAGLLLALVISTKVYPIILLPFLLFKKEFRTLAYTLFGLALTHLIVTMYFGAGSDSLYLEWYTKQVSNGLQCTHLNQSLWSLVCGLFSETSRFNNWYFNIFSFTVSHTKLITLSIIGIIGIWVAYVFYKYKDSKNALATQWLIVLSFIPIFSPLAWKCYFVFLVPVCILLYFKFQESHLKKWFIIPFLFITFTSELFIGNRWSDYSESIGIITLSSLIISLFATHFLHIQNEKISLPSTDSNSL